MKKILIAITSYLLPIIGCQLISIYYASNRDILGPLFKIICFNIAYNLFLTYFSKSDDRSKQIRQTLNTWIYYIYSIVLISWIIEYTSKFYAYRQLAHFMLFSAKSGAPTFQVYGWRCSGAYYFETYCDLESKVKYMEEDKHFLKLRKKFIKGLFGHSSFGSGQSSKATNSKLWSGYHISCNNNHTMEIKSRVKLNSWDGPRPSYVLGQDCTHGKGKWSIY